MWFTSLFKRKRNENYISNKYDIINDIKNDCNILRTINSEENIKYISIELLNKFNNNCKIFIKNINNFNISLIEFENLLSNLQQHNVNIDIISFDQSNEFINMINKLNNINVNNKINLYIGIIKNNLSISNYIVGDYISYIVEQPHKIDFNYNKSKNNMAQYCINDKSDILISELYYWFDMCKNKIIEKIG